MSGRPLLSAPQGSRPGMSKLAAAFLMVFGCSNAAVSQPERRLHITMQDDLLKRPHDIHWPEGFIPEKADLFSHNELLVETSCEKVWGHIVDASKWPNWYPNSKNVNILDGEGLLKADTRWRWTTFGLPLESRVHEYVPNSRLGWFGYAPGQKPAFYHTWLLIPRGTSCQVVMDEVGKGADAANLRRSNESLMHRGHDLWLATLKWVSETE
jgi:uncharacterized protein YndB with AHSA1/START domain